MPPLISRRQLLNTTLGCAAGLSAGALAPRRALGHAAKGALVAAPLGENLFLISGAGGNVVAGIAAEAVLLVDGGLAERTSDLLRLIGARSRERRVTQLFNTHWHWDHTGSNETLAKRGAAIIAHENTKLWLGAEIESKWENRTYRPRPALALPTETFFYGARHVDFASESVEYGYLPQAHTDGDIYVLFPKANVLVAGDVVAGGSYPIADYCTGGWLGGMITALRTLIGKADAETRIVPGSGALRTRADLEGQLEMCLTSLQRIADSYYKGETWEELVASKPTREFDATWGNPALFLQTAYEGAWNHINEIRRVTR